MKLYPHLPEAAFIQVGDFIGDGLRHCCSPACAAGPSSVGMIGKLKMANGKMMTHAASGRDCAWTCWPSCGRGGAAAELIAAIRQANTARHVLEECGAAAV